MFTFLDKYLEGKTSRELQNYQHKVGGIYGVLLIATGSYLVRDFWIGISTGILSLFISRLSSEISYRTQQKLHEEQHKNEKSYDL